MKYYLVMYYLYLIVLYQNYSSPINKLIPSDPIQMKLFIHSNWQVHHSRKQKTLIFYRYCSINNKLWWYIGRYGKARSSDQFEKGKKKQININKYDEDKIAIYGHKATRGLALLKLNKEAGKYYKSSLVMCCYLFCLTNGTTRHLLCVYV